MKIFKCNKVEPLKMNSVHHESKNISSKIHQKYDLNASLGFVSPATPKGTELEETLQDRSLSQLEKMTDDTSLYVPQQHNNNEITCRSASVTSAFREIDRMLAATNSPADTQKLLPSTSVMHSEFEEKVTSDKLEFDFCGRRRIAMVVLLMITAEGELPLDISRLLLQNGQLLSAIIELKPDEARLLKRHLEQSNIELSDIVSR